MAPAFAGARGQSAAQKNQGLAAGGIDRPRPPHSRRAGSVLAFDADARQRRLKEAGVPITGFDHERHRHAAQHGELVNDGFRRGRLRWLGLGGHAPRGCNAGAMGPTDGSGAFPADARIPGAIRCKMLGSE